MYTEIIIILAAVLVSSVIIAVVVISCQKKLGALRDEVTKQQTLLSVAEARSSELSEEKERLQQQISTLQTDLTNKTAGLNTARSLLEERTEQAKKDAADQQEKFRTELQLAREKMRTQFEEEMRLRTEQFKKANAEQMETVVAPLQKELNTLRELVSTSKEAQEKNTATLYESIKAVVEHDKQRDKTTQDLAEALKNRGKVQGDWGEQVLTNILQESGLREGVEYFFQKNIKNTEGEDLRPDVIVRAADGTNIIIDSKVSLTAYTEYVGAENDILREKACKENYDSIWKHVKELASKNYKKEVNNAIPVVMMFIPNEGSYILAMNKDPQLGSKAFKEGILIINPTNLMLVLQLVLITWHNTRQEENNQAIVRLAEDIFDKYRTFTESYVRLGNSITSSEKVYQEGLRQLSEGKGNLSNRIQSLLNYGVVPRNRNLPPSVLPTGNDHEDTD